MAHPDHPEDTAIGISGPKALSSDDFGLDSPSEKGNMVRKRRRQRPVLVIIAAVCVLAAMGIFFVQQQELSDATYSIGRFAPTGLKQKKFDVNAPPIPKELMDKVQGHISAEDENLDREQIVFWGQQSNRLQHSQKSGKRRKPKKKLRKIPIIEDDDDKVPQGLAGSDVRVEDMLMCGKGVMDYVVNATDLKDECGGLKKAFKKYCFSDEEQPQQKVKVESSRRLERSNPIHTWRDFIRQLSNYITSVQKPVLQIFMVDDAISEPDEIESHEIEDRILMTFTTREDSVGRKKNRYLQEVDKKEAETGDVDKQEEVQKEETTVELSTRAKNKTIEKPMSLSIPTTSHHVPEEMISGTLMLQNEDKVIASAVQAAQNQTNATVKAAVADAAASAKAVSATADFVSSVLNDPTAVEARTCCASILNAFQENCSSDEEEEISDSRLFIVVLVIALCGLVKSLIRHFQLRWLPEAAGCILVGVISGWILSYFPHRDVSFEGNWFLRIMVPPIVFEAALSIDKQSFNRHIVPILIYAIAGTLLATGLTALIVHHGSVIFHGFCETIPFIEALTFGALISSIDPIAVLSVLSNMGMTDTDTIYVVIFGESLLNDGVAIVLFQTLVHFLDANMKVDGQAIMAACTHFLVVACGSFLVGVTSGYCCTLYFWAMHGCQTPLIEVLLFCCWALLPYYVCDGIEWSGIVAVVATGFVMDINVVGQTIHGEASAEMLNQANASPSKNQTSPQRERRGGNGRRRPVFSRDGHLSSEAKAHIGFVTEVLSTMMETAIFAYLGLFLFSYRYHWNLIHTLLAIGGCCVSRAIMIPTLSCLANWITRAQQIRPCCDFKSQQQQQSASELTRRVGHNAPAGVVLDPKMQLVLWFAGLRGAMSFALVENIPQYDAVSGEGSRFKSELKAMTSASIIFTVFILGGTTYYMMDSLGMAPSKSTAKQLSPKSEMVSLLSKSGSYAEEDPRSGDDDQSDLYKHDENGSNATSTFRQRIQH